jgi:predicted DsbA family dithiol-disulfide isomerase
MQAASIIGIAPEVRLRGFRLHPEWPADGLSWRDFQMRRHLPDPVFDRIAQVARAEGIDLDFSRIVRVPDTAPLHRLLLAAQPHGLALRLYRAFAQAYFFDGINLADRDTVLAVAASAGLDPEAAGLALEDPDLTALLEADEAQGRVLGIQGVPFLLAKGRALPGAVSPSAYQTLLQRLTARPG